ncbi:MAG: tRNA (guanosine(37)-N1)-methyltransferase TrmD [Coriobacteriales bacterium]|nr:tRNA (guanosine(37)-N1)-methyltransferase TrmD [Coriobacteriales bacterium]
MRIEALTVFPQMIDSYVHSSVLGRALEAGVFSFEAHDLRDWTHDRHKTVDDAPYGGGQGMLMKCTPFFEALDELCNSENPAYTIFFTPTGKPFTQSCAQELAAKERLLLVCGHYEGIDERVYTRADACFSLGDYVLTGGELAAMVVIDATVRLLPGALGDDQSAQDESFSDGLLEYEQYTRPPVANGLKVPDILLSGNHARIAAWRRANALVRTCDKRPDLLETANLTPAEKNAVAHYFALIAQGISGADAAKEAFPILRE